MNDTHAEAQELNGSSPFAGLEALFAADQEPQRYEFEVWGRPCYVELRPMDASADAKFRSKSGNFRVDMSKREISEGTLQIDQDEQEIELLLGTVYDGQFVRKKRAHGGEEVIEMTPALVNLTKGARSDLFRTLSRDFRARLVRLCCEVNGMPPLLPMPEHKPEGSGVPTSTSSSTA